MFLKIPGSNLGVDATYGGTRGRLKTATDVREKRAIPGGKKKKKEGKEGNMLT